MNHPVSRRTFLHTINAITGAFSAHLVRLSAVALLGSAAGSSGAQQPAKPLAGLLDLHIHFAPDITPRSVDAIEGARLAREAGMRAIVLKNHYAPTAAEAYLVRQAVPGIEVFGGIALNLSVGGMNPAAVERMAQMQGHYGRIVWMNSFDSEAQVRSERSTRSFVRISKDGKLLPVAIEVIAMIARYHLVLATGHNTPEEDLLLIKEAHRQGVEHVIVTHAMMTPIHMTIPQMKRAAALGALIEFAYNGTIGKVKEFELADYARAIRAIGATHCILSTDLGQDANPLPTEGFITYINGLKAEGITATEIDQMARVNPAHVLGLD